jgi:hypothetical protein
MARRGPVRRALAGAALGAGQGVLLGVLLLVAAGGTADPGRRGTARPLLLLGFGRAVATACVAAVLAAGGLAAWLSGYSVFGIVLTTWVATTAAGAGLGLAAGRRGWWEWID